MQQVHLIEEDLELPPANEQPPANETTQLLQQGGNEEGEGSVQAEANADLPAEDPSGVGKYFTPVCACIAAGYKKTEINLPKFFLETLPSLTGVIWGCITLQDTNKTVRRIDNTVRRIDNTVRNIQTDMGMDRQAFVEALINSNANWTAAAQASTAMLASALQTNNATLTSSLDRMVDRLEASHDRMATSHDRMMASHDRMAASHDRLEASLDRMAASQDRLEASLDRMAASQDRLAAAFENWPMANTAGGGQNMQGN